MVRILLLAVRAGSLGKMQVRSWRRNPGVGFQARASASALAGNDSERARPGPASVPGSVSIGRLSRRPLFGAHGQQLWRAILRVAANCSSRLSVILSLCPVTALESQQEIAWQSGRFFDRSERSDPVDPISTVHQIARPGGSLHWHAVGRRRARFANSSPFVMGLHILRRDSCQP